MDRVILHSDLNNFYASAECLYRPELRERPVAVGGDVEQRHGIILAKNYTAKRFGVKTGEAIWQARQKCPGLEVVPPNFPLYLHISGQMRKIYSDYSDQIEPFGLDESWLDVTGGMGKDVADDIRRRVREEIGITASVGVSFNKIFAKLGSDMKKPDATTVITRENYKSLVWPLPVGELLYVGAATRKRLESWNVHTIGDLALTDPGLLQRKLGKWGLTLHCFANGLDNSPVARAGAEAAIKSIGNSTTTPRDLTCDQDVEIVLLTLAESVAMRLREQKLMCRTVELQMRNSRLASFSRQIARAVPTNLALEILDSGMELFRRNYNWAAPIRSLGIRGIDLIPELDFEQLSLFDDIKKRTKHTNMELAMDDIRRRFGNLSIRRAVTLLDAELGGLDAKADHVIYPVGFKGAS